MAGLYVHFPFCEHRCSYCDFYTRTDGDRARQARFVATLLMELDLLRARADFPERFDTFYCGGGTPSLLAPDSWTELAAGVRERLGFSADAEWSLEANPETVDARRLEHLRGLGFTRISFGVQSFDAAELTALERIHSAPRAEEAVRSARAAGFASISLDLMSALPGQDWARFAPSLERALTLPVDHMSIYLLEVKPGTPLAAQVAAGAAAEVAEERQEEMYLNTSARLGAAGFGHYEISSFARAGHTCRHNLKYWRREPVWAAGPSAHGFTGSVQFANPADLDAWEAALVQGKLPWKWSRTLDARESRRDHLLFGLRLQEGVALQDLAADAGFLEELLQAGFAHMEQGRVRLTARGWFRSGEILARLL